MTQNAKTLLDGMNLSNKFLFDETMEDPEAYSATVSILLEQEIELLDRVETEKELRVSPELRSVRLDVVGMDTDKKVYYTEMQKRDTNNLKKRSRYYQGQMDVSLLEPGCKDFNALPDTCFILVAPFDIFGRGLYRYTFEGQCRECPDLKIDDGALRIFINTNGTNKEAFSEEFLNFMKYINKTTDETAAKVESERIKLIHKRVQQIRTSEKMGVKVMQWWEELEYEREDARAAGHAEGHAEGLAAGHAEGLAEGLVEGRVAGRAEEMIATCQEFGVPKEEILERLVRKLLISEEKAEKYMMQYYIE